MKNWTPRLRPSVSVRRRKSGSKRGKDPRWYEYRVVVFAGLCCLVLLSFSVAWAAFALSPGLQRGAENELRYLRAARRESGELQSLAPATAAVNISVSNATVPVRWPMRPRDARGVVDHVLDHSLRVPQRLDAFETRLERYAVNLRILQERTLTLHTSVERQMSSLEKRWAGNVTDTSATMAMFGTKLERIDHNVTALSGPIQRAMHDYVKLTKERTTELIKRRVELETAPFETRIDALEALFEKIEQRSAQSRAAAAKKSRGSGYWGR